MASLTSNLHALNILALIKVTRSHISGPSHLAFHIGPSVRPKLHEISPLGLMPVPGMLTQLIKIDDMVS